MIELNYYRTSDNDMKTVGWRFNAIQFPLFCFGAVNLQHTNMDPKLDDIEQE